MRCFIVVLGCLALTACKTSNRMKAQSMGDESMELVNTYDGASDSIDSLPDCTPELAGTFFWVRSDKAGYDCTVAGEWKIRQNAKKPDTEN